MLSLEEGTERRWCQRKESCIQMNIAERSMGQTIKTTSKDRWIVDLMQKWKGIVDRSGQALSMVDICSQGLVSVRRVKHNEPPFHSFWKNKTRASSFIHKQLKWLQCLIPARHESHQSKKSNFTFAWCQGCTENRFISVPFNTYHLPGNS